MTTTFAKNKKPLLTAKAFYLKDGKTPDSIILLNAASDIPELSYYKVDLPLMRESRNNTKNTTNKIFAIPAALAAIPPNPNIAAIMATTRNVMVQRNIK